MNLDSLAGCSSLVNGDIKSHVSINGATNLLPLQQTNNSSSSAQSSLTTVYNEGKGQNKKLYNPNHNQSLLQSAKYYCEKQEFVDLAIHCEDGVIHAHQIVLAVASPLLNQLFQTNPTHGLESLAIALPEVKSCLVQALIHFVYTGKVVTQEGQFYSLMKLVYALNINGLIEAESTKNLPTTFQTVIQSFGTKKRADDCDYLSSRKRQKVEDDLVMNSCVGVKYSNGSGDNCLLQVNGSLPKLPMQAVSLPRIRMPHVAKPGDSMSYHTHSMPSISSQSNTIPSMSSHQRPSTSFSCPSPAKTISTPSTRVVNSLTASGVVIKEEPEEKPNLSLSQGTHFVAVTSYPVKVEHPCQSVSICSSLTSPRSTQSISSPGSILSIAGTGTGINKENTNNQNKDSQGSNDPLAAIMNQTIFGGEAMLIVGGAGAHLNGKQYLEIPGATQVTPGGTLKLLEDAARQTWAPGREEAGRPQAAAAADDDNTARAAPGRAITSETVDDLPCTPDDEDLNISYNCETCNRSIKGRVMLQAHQYQEHFDNPEYDAASIPEEKFACRVCLKVFTRNSDVKAHILRVHCGDRRYPCTMCGKRFKESTHLRKHLYTHTGERPHYCQLCTKGFQTSSDLKRHKRTRVHQERVEQLNNGKLSDTDGGPLDNNAEYNRWTDETEEDLDCGGRLNSSSRLPSGSVCTRLESPQYLPIQSKPLVRAPPRTTHVTRPPQSFPPRLCSSGLTTCTTSLVTMSMSSSLLSQFHSPPTPAAPLPHLLTSPGLQFSSSSPSLQFSTTSSPTTSVQFPTSSPSLQLGNPSHLQLGNPSISSLQLGNPSSILMPSNGSLSSGSQFLGSGQVGASGASGASCASVRNQFVASSSSSPSLSLSNSTIDLSDIKWGLCGPGLGGSVLEARDELFPSGSPVLTVKRSVSTESPHDGERLTIQEDSIHL